MSVISTRYRELVVRLSPRREGCADFETCSPSTTGEIVRVYDAWLYSPEPLPSVKPPVRVPSDFRIASGMPVVGRERVTLRWNRYQEYLASFVDGEAGYQRMGDRLWQTLSDGLRGILSEAWSDARSVRIWWSGETPELADMPWELMARSATPFSLERRNLFVRGLPPETPPLQPLVKGRLRLALIHDREADIVPQALREALQSVEQELEIVRYSDSPRRALQEAARDGIELVHIVADGFVSLSYEGILYLHDPRRRELSPELGPGELSSILSGSRVGLIGLSETRTRDPDRALIGSQQVPSVYRAFACLGAARQTLPTMVAPLGPMEPSDIRTFWSEFYRGLSENFGVHKAVARGRANRLLPIAVFLRQRYSRLFSRTGSVPDSDCAPAALAAYVNRSRELIEQVQSLQTRTVNLSPGINEFLKRESGRNAEMQQRLDPFLQSAEEESE